jgi:hypothetical protein
VDLILKKARELLTIMTGCPEYKYWIKDNPKLEIPDEMLPHWTGCVAGLEQLVKRLKDELGKD